ncbi:hypothetical protein DFH07DRAFT_688173, partial [Mycena maculata]
ILGFLLNWGLFGSLSVQLYLYYLAFPDDRTFAKVYTVYLIEFVATIMLTHDAFSIYGYGFTDPSAATTLSLSWLEVPVMGGFVAFLAQSFYSYRAHVLSKSLLIPCLITAVSAVSEPFLLPVSWLNSVQAGSVTNLEVHRVKSAQVWLRSSAICDITIAVCMTYYLTKNDTGFHRTHQLVSRLTRLIIETGSLTAVVALAALILLLALPRDVYYSTPVTILVELYANTILVVLNSRMKIVGGRGTETSS